MQECGHLGSSARAKGFGEGPGAVHAPPPALPWGWGCISPSPFRGQRGAVPPIPVARGIAAFPARGLGTEGLREAGSSPGCCCCSSWRAGAVCAGLLPALAPREQPLMHTRRCRPLSWGGRRKPKRGLLPPLPPPRVSWQCQAPSAQGVRGGLGDPGPGGGGCQAPELLPRHL